MFTEQDTPKLKETVSVANNACWAIGELAVKVCVDFHTNTKFWLLSLLGYLSLLTCFFLRSLKFMFLFWFGIKIMYKEKASRLFWTNAGNFK